MDFILDDPATELVFQEILRKVKTLQNGDTFVSMTKRGLNYKVNYGASIVSLQRMALNYKQDHLLALKLWNKQWRETLILATLLDESAKVTENQIDFWVKNIPTIEIAEQAVMNLFSKTSFAFSKAYSWCLSKKLLVKITGLLLIGRLALTDKSAVDEQFDPFFQLMPPLSKDPELSKVFIRTFIQVGRRNNNLMDNTLQHARLLNTTGSEMAAKNAQEIISILKSEDRA